MTAVSSTPLEFKIRSAADFLLEVHEKGYDESDLRKYLMNKQGLTTIQIDQAFILLRDWLRSRTSVEDKESPPRASFAIPVKLTQKSVTSDQKDKYDLHRRYSEERSEIVSKSRKVAEECRSLSCLKPEKQVVGDVLFKEFLRTELDYCKLLECLWNDYYPKLSQHAVQGKIDMTRNEVELLFEHVPTLLKFHRSFYIDLNKGSDIGRHFVRLFEFFKGYIDYMKNCSSTVDKMRRYTRDKRLFKCLEQAREASICKNWDMTDLMLFPLDRINDYKTFLGQLYQWANKEENRLRDPWKSGKKDRESSRFY